jgi:hypothetical protein
MGYHLRLILISSIESGIILTDITTGLEDNGRNNGTDPNLTIYTADHPQTFLNQSIDKGHCVALVEKAAHAPHDLDWRRGPKVSDIPDLPWGTAIATFDPNGRYGNHSDGTSHAALYLYQDDAGIVVIDQWINKDKTRHKASQRTIPWHDKSHDSVDNAYNYHVITK